MLPDHTPRATGRASSPRSVAVSPPRACERRPRDRSRGTGLVLRGGDAALQRAGEIARRRGRLLARRLRAAALRLGLDEGEQALAVVVAQRGRIERRVERGDELLGERALRRGRGLALG